MIRTHIGLKLENGKFTTLCFAENCGNYLYSLSLSSKTEIYVPFLFSYTKKGYPIQREQICCIIKFPQAKISESGLYELILEINVKKDRSIDFQIFDTVSKTKLQIIKKIQSPETSLNYNVYGSFETYNEKAPVNKQDIWSTVLKLHEIKSKDDEVLKSYNQSNKNPEDIYYEMIESAKSTKHTIGAKLISIISLILILSLGLITYLVSVYVTKDVRINAEDNNLSINYRSAVNAENKFKSVYSIVTSFLELRDLSDLESQKKFFSQNEEIVAICLLDNGDYLFNIDSSFSGKKKLDDIQDIINDNNGFVSSFYGEQIAINVSNYFNYPVIALSYPYRYKNNDDVLVIFFSSESISESFGTSSINSSFMVSKDGIVLAHSDKDLVLSCVDLSQNELIKRMVQSDYLNQQMFYTDNDGIEYLGAFTKINTAEIGVLTIIKSSVIYEATLATTRRNVYLAIIVLSLSILIIWFFSKSISGPVKALAVAAKEITNGNYDLKIKPHSKDELGLLTESFINMSKGLSEREKLKNAFGRFINKDIAEKVLKGELSLGGETKKVTVFFSDIRSFTAISEKLEPYEVVGFLNEYMTQMVSCVNKTGGVVDKFIGDAVMAVWGAPVSLGDEQKNALSCVKAALMMRQALIKFNQGRGGDKKPIIKIGCGINSGSVVAGQIGSNERMEYTVIGDAVNLASRTESLNKPFGTDILITENTYVLIKDYILVEEMPSVNVKGKVDPIKMYAVIDLIDSKDAEISGEVPLKSLQQIRALLNIKEPDLNGVDVDAEEKKYQIKTK